MPTNPRIGEGAKSHMKRNTNIGMLHRQLDPAKGRSLKKMSLGGIRIIVEKTIMSPRRNLRIEMLLDIILGTLKIGKEQEAQVLEVRDIAGEIEAWTDRVEEEITMMIEESIEVGIVPVEESLAQIGRLGGSIA